MPSDTKLKQLIINVLPKAEFNENAKNPDELFFVTDDNNRGTGYHNGDVFFTMRLDDLDGAVECNGLQYNLSDINGGDNNLQELLEQGKLPYVSIAQHTATVSQYGSCRAFGWDGGDVVVVPKLNDVYIKIGTAETPDEFLEQELPNITGVLDCTGAGSVGLYLKGSSGAFSEASPTSGQLANKDGGTTYREAHFNAHDSNPVYKDDAKVQPDSVRYRAMIQLFNGVTDEALATCTSVLADVAALKEKVAIAFAAGGRYLVRKKEQTADDPTWYNVYSDGFCEQGGFTPNVSGSSSITFPILMRNRNYAVSMAAVVSASNARIVQVLDTRTESTLTFITNSGFPSIWRVNGYCDPSEYTRDKWGDDTDYSTVSVMTGDPSPFKFKAWTNAESETVYTLLAVPVAQGDDMYPEDQLAVVNAGQVPTVVDHCGAIGIVNGNRAINGGGTIMGTPGAFDPTTAYVRNQALDTNG